MIFLVAGFQLVALNLAVLHHNKLGRDFIFYIFFQIGNLAVILGIGRKSLQIGLCVSVCEIKSNEN